MALSALPGLDAASMTSAARIAPKSARETAEQDIKQRFEQMLWTEMLSHAGLEKALTLGGGEAASSFSRFVVEAIAKDLAETHPLGLAEHVNLPSFEDAAANQEVPE
ncbi:MAG: hypothetical protein FP825_05295 [Hyphomonas sp.]|uniref:hypothetical protein n=1 Tax=Hyphomonas sp. TaxID=87 RepID=UPI0017C90968|nr:hypothetical protein [Hyphomonas sp.]MBA3067883.1 hypothetical protein [Hyphomonas sp.]MBU3921602.1 hypothetical protein [Alphaproteobacteria bacterium]MBU4062439.1 hypothetical protein [Alphaproteobacteria bacterium]MBU4165952.1 hypothetical protein [Alphaproteobacteria bacterium]